MKLLFFTCFIVVSCSAMITGNDTRSISKLQECWNSKKLECIKKHFGNPQKEQKNSITYFHGDNEYLNIYFDKENQQIKGIEFWIYSPLSLDADAIKKILVSSDWKSEKLPEKNPHVVNLAMANYSLKLNTSFLTYQLHPEKPVKVIYWGADYKDLEF